MGMDSCKICGNNQDNTFFKVREMQLGLREVFTYMKCGQCGCLILRDIPQDLGKYYPNENYYSFNRELNVQSKPDLLRKIKASYLLYGKHALLGSLLSIGYKVPDYISWLKIPGIKYDDAILDVGTGNGSLLLNLHQIGFTHLTGIDPFISKDKDYGNIRILKKDIFELDGQFDYIMLHHAFEHMDEPLKVLQRLYELLKAQRYLLIRTPVMGGYSWNHYRENWMDIDAPRHLVVHSLESMRLLAKKAGFEIKQVVFDSIYVSLVGSEQYKKNIALPDPDSYMVNKNATDFTGDQIQSFIKLAEKNNIEGQGDQAAFYLYKS